MPSLSFFNTLHAWPMASLQSFHNISNSSCDGVWQGIHSSTKNNFRSCSCLSDNTLYYNTFYSAMNHYGISTKLSFDRWTASLEILEKVKNLEYFSTTSTGFNNYASLICGKGSASSSAAKVDHLMCLMN